MSVCPVRVVERQVFCFASIMYEIEWDYGVETCAQHWIEMGVTRDFLTTRGSVRWGCDVCDQLVNVTSLECAKGVPAATCKEQQASSSIAQGARSHRDHTEITRASKRRSYRRVIL